MGQALTIYPSTARLGLRRVGAWLLDWLLILVWIGLLTVAGLVLDVRSWQLSQTAWDITFALLTVVPITLWLARWESRGGTPGKRVLRLRVTALHDGPPSLWRALLRNALKVALPWQLGHLVAADFMSTPVDATVPASTYVSSVVVYALMALYLGGLFLGSGRPLYDVLAGTDVAPAGDGPAA